jgi:plasmid stabilization system protein ParE
MKRAALLSVLLCAACTGAGIRLPFSSLHGNAVHRFFPDLDRRENAVRYGRWNAVESAWIHGVNPETDRALTRELLATIRRLPDFPPDPRLAAPRLCREAPALFGALEEADRFEREITDALAATDATPETTSSRVEKILVRYRRSPFALEAPQESGVDPQLGQYEAARLLLEGDWLFARAAENLAAASWVDQRWKVRETVDRYDREIDSPPGSLDISWYHAFAPTFTGEYPAVAELFDRATRYRIEIFEALLASGPDARRSAAAAIARRYGLHA